MFLFSYLFSVKTFLVFIFLFSSISFLPLFPYSRLLFVHFLFSPLPLFLSVMIFQNFLFFSSSSYLLTVPISLLSSFIVLSFLLSLFLCPDLTTFSSFFFYLLTLPISQLPSFFSSFFLSLFLLCPNLTTLLSFFSSSPYFSFTSSYPYFSVCFLSFPHSLT